MNRRERYIVRVLMDRYQETIGALEYNIRSLQEIVRDRIPDLSPTQAAIRAQTLARIRGSLEVVIPGLRTELSTAKAELEIGAPMNHLTLDASPVPQDRRTH